MRLVDIVSGMNLTVYPIISLIIFVGIFLIVLVRVARASRTDVQHLASLPNEPDTGLERTQEVDHG